MSSIITSDISDTDSAIRKLTRISQVDIVVTRVERALRVHAGCVYYLYDVNKKGRYPMRAGARLVKSQSSSAGAQPEQ